MIKPTRLEKDVLYIKIPCTAWDQTSIYLREDLLKTTGNLRVGKFRDSDSLNAAMYAWR